MTAVCMAAAANRAGARNTMYLTPPSAPVCPRLTSDPSPSPIAARNKTGCNTLETADPRHVRL